MCRDKKCDTIFRQYKQIDNLNRYFRCCKNIISAFLELSGINALVIIQAAYFV